MSTPNPTYQPPVVLNANQIYFDGWEVTLMYDWDMYHLASVDTWNGLDVVLHSNKKSYASLVIETPAGAETTYRASLKAVAGYYEGSVSLSYGGGLSTDAPPDVWTWPAGSRIYMPLSAYDMQYIVNHMPVVLACTVVDSQWAPLDGYQPTLVNADGTAYSMPDVGSNTGLLLTCYPSASGMIVLSEKTLTLAAGWGVASSLSA